MSEKKKLRVVTCPECGFSFVPDVEHPKKFKLDPMYRYRCRDDPTRQVFVSEEHLKHVHPEACNLNEHDWRSTFALWGLSL